MSSDQPTVLLSSETFDHQCLTCKRSFRTEKGLKQHSRHCKFKQQKQLIQPTPTAAITATPDKVPTPNKNIDPHAKEFQPENIAKYRWGRVDDKTFEKDLHFIYEKIVYWRKNLFLLPTGKAGKRYIDEITRLLNAWEQDSAIKHIAFKAIMVMPNLLLQKPSKKSKSKDHLKALDRRLHLWEDGNLIELYHESDTIQNSFDSMPRPRSVAEISKKFAGEMQKGNINSAIKLLTDNMQNGILPLDNSTLDSLQIKHPTAKQAMKEALLDDTPLSVHQIKFENIDGEAVRKAALRTKGGSGPSGMDGEGWKRIFTSNSYGDSCVNICKAFAAVIRKLCINECEQTSLEAFLACRLIPLDKNPGLRPIGVGEILRRIAGKVVTATLKDEILHSIGSLQVCAGHDAGCEALIHAMKAIFEEEETEAVLLVDASNAFNTVNRNVFLHNIKVICPPLATFVHNCYALPSRLFVIGGTEIKSSEGTTQGDPASMAIYAIAIIPLILMLLEISLPVKSAAYADDLTSAGALKNLKNWWTNLLDLGPKFGYSPEASKSWLIVKDRYADEAKQIFEGTNIKITTQGKRHLGAVIGSDIYKDKFINEKINTWIKEIRVLSDIAKIEPQAAYSCFIIGYKNKISFFLRTIPNISIHLKRLDEVITTEFIPAITNGIQCNELERSFLSLPTKMGGLAIPIFSEISDLEYEYSQSLTSSLKRDIIAQERKVNTIPPTEENNSPSEIRRKIKNDKHKLNEENLIRIRVQMNEEKRRLNDLNREEGASIWLTTAPLKDEGYSVSKQEFWDLIRIRYGWYLKRIPEFCECGNKFDIWQEVSGRQGRLHFLM